MDNQNFGKDVFTKSFDPDSVNGWGKRTYNWEMGVSLQHECCRRGGHGRLLPSVVGNFYTANNRLTTTPDYTPFSIPIPPDRRLPAAAAAPSTGWTTWCRPGRSGGPGLAALFEFRRDDRELARRGRRRERAVAQWPDGAGRHELGPAVSGPLRRAVGVARDLQLGEHGGRGATRPLTSTGALANPYCNVVEPFLTSFRGSATYLVPKVDLKVSGTWRSFPGPDFGGNHVVTTPSRPCRSAATSRRERHRQSGSARDVYGARINNIDMRIAKIFRFGGTRTQVGVDLYNLTDSDEVTGYNAGYYPTGAWLTPTAILPARYARINLQLDF